MVKGLIASVGLCAIATACSMEGRLRRRGAFEVCDASPMVEPWLSRKGEGRRRRSFHEAVIRSSAGTVATRPLAATEVAALVGRVPIGYGSDVLVLEVTVSLAASSLSGLQVGPQAYGHDAVWRQPSLEDGYALFGVTPPPAEPSPARKTMVGGSLFVLTLGIVDIDDRWGSVTRGSAKEPSEDTRAGRDAVMQMFVLERPRRVEPGDTVTSHLLVARTQGTGPVALDLMLEPQPEGCLFLGGKSELEVTVPADGPSTVAFDGEDLKRAAW